jgi:hypothetical protein
MLPYEAMGLRFKLLSTVSSVRAMLDAFLRDCPRQVDVVDVLVERM